MINMGKPGKEKLTPPLGNWTQEVTRSFVMVDTLHGVAALPR
jgi:hypothetical protein